MLSSNIFTLSGLLLGALAAGTSVYVLFTVVYRLWFHPLAKFPGPFLAKITNLYAGVHAWRGDIHMDIWASHEKYGPYVRYAPDRLLVNTSTGLKEIYSFNAPVQKSKAYQAMVHRAPNVLTSIEKKQHGRRRRILAQGLSDAALRRYEPTIKVHVDKLCQQMKGGDTSSEWSEPKNMGKWASYFTFDVMTDLVFGEQYKLMEDEKNRFVIEAIEDSNVRTGTLIQAPEFGIRRLDRRLFAASILARNSFIKFVSKLLRQRMEIAPLKRNDIFTFLLNAKDPETGEGFTPAEIGAESTTLIVAGSDTTSTSIAACLFYLSRNADAYAKAAAEVRSKFASGDDVKMGPELNSCIYLRACIDEALRMSPAAGAVPWREVKAGGYTVDGHFIPEGYDVGTGIYSIHHNSEYFPEPFEYRPERWLATNENGELCEGKTPEIAQAREAWNPFSIGPRSCIGKGLAITELMLSLSAVLASFDLRVAKTEDGKLGGGSATHVEPLRRREGEYQLWDHITGGKAGPVLQFKSVVSGEKAN